MATFNGFRKVQQNLLIRRGRTNAGGWYAQCERRATDKYHPTNFLVPGQLESRAKLIAIPTLDHLVELPKPWHSRGINNARLPLRKSGAPPHVCTSKM